MTKSPEEIIKRYRHLQENDGDLQEMHDLLYGVYLAYYANTYAMMKFMKEFELSDSYNEWREIHKEKLAIELAGVFCGPTRN